jgi:hypothetical protein
MEREQIMSSKEELRKAEPPKDPFTARQALSLHDPDKLPCSVEESEAEKLGITVEEYLKKNPTTSRPVCEISQEESSQLSGFYSGVEE